MSKDTNGCLEMDMDGDKKWVPFKHTQVLIPNIKSNKC